jgi:hypothetical protein
LNNFFDFLFDVKALLIERYENGIKSRFIDVKRSKKEDKTSLKDACIL